ncbi:imidazole glycerol phosphate synthase subunit HisH [Vibrio sp. Of7-15]|uniref:imidazole glycerol phosphate synthase subunit HisH n=1 Tax=Vibrio sp. Of7-15 TaxID=2724879 RepID=UPI001EF1D94E|nr:imidazole glycerol phosphate synthase subunit HisH [Vibrio sp. Of7-15]MCG7496845.1 imidazole glycerol phosphate synthase subunit HisH [Vibrio sp. Of7-15]
MLKVIDLKVGNIGSITKAISHLGFDYELVTEPEQLLGASKIILPGVGGFSAASERIFNSGFADALNKYVVEDEIPILGICVGMQLLAKSGDEGYLSPGLGYIDAVVKKIDSMNNTLIVPHMGWNDVDFGTLRLFNDIEENSCFYFVHSYSMRINDTQDVNVAYTDYGENIVAYVNKKNVHGTQFHPEKSQSVGLKFIRNFIELC